MKFSLALMLTAAAFFDVSAETRFDELDRLYRSGDRRYVFVVAHRGLPDPERGIPENSFAAITNAVASGADIVEIDPKITCDRRIVLLHNANPHDMVYGNCGFGTVGLGPTANWHGQLENCYLKRSPADNRPSAERICLLEDALEAVRDKAFLWLDTNIWLTSDNLDVIYEIIERKHMERQCLFGSGLNGGQNRPIPKWMRFFDRSGRICTGTLDQNTPTDFNDSSALEDDRFGWTRRLDAGSTVVMTDRPVELIAYLKRHGRRNAAIETDTRRMVAPLTPTNVVASGSRVCQGAADTADYRVVEDRPSAESGERSVVLQLKDPKRTRWTDTTDGRKRVWYRALAPSAEGTR